VGTKRRPAPSAHMHRDEALFPPEPGELAPVRHLCPDTEDFLDVCCEVPGQEEAKQHRSRGGAAATTMEEVPAGALFTVSAAAAEDLTESQVTTAAVPASTPPHPKNNAAKPKPSKRLTASGESELKDNDIVQRKRFKSLVAQEPEQPDAGQGQRILPRRELSELKVVVKQLKLEEFPKVKKEELPHVKGKALNCGTFDFTDPRSPTMEGRCSKRFGFKLTGSLPPDLEKQQFSMAFGGKDDDERLRERKADFMEAGDGCYLVCFYYPTYKDKVNKLLTTYSDLKGKYCSLHVADLWSHKLPYPLQFRTHKRKSPALKGVIQSARRARARCETTEDHEQVDTVLNGCTEDLNGICDNRFSIVGVIIILMLRRICGGFKSIVGVVRLQC